MAMMTSYTGLPPARPLTVAEQSRMLQLVEIVQRACRELECFADTTLVCIGDLQGCRSGDSWDTMGDEQVVANFLICLTGTPFSCNFSQLISEPLPTPAQLSEQEGQLVVDFVAYVSSWIFNRLSEQAEKVCKPLMTVNVDADGSVQLGGSRPQVTIFKGEPQQIPPPRVADPKVAKALSELSDGTRLRR